jgi:hypothetical protein
VRAVTVWLRVLLALGALIAFCGITSGAGGRGEGAASESLAAAGLQLPRRACRRVEAAFYCAAIGAIQSVGPDQPRARSWTLAPTEGRILGRLRDYRLTCQPPPGAGSGAKTRLGRRIP